ncbi:MAG: hypothetical protein DME26_09490 [Verrucomicrobia bacterium]|nr:MAG: hypothetical protein DME26_09490 [Verrucomicrobiota bacterium]
MNPNMPTKQGAAPPVIRNAAPRSAWKVLVPVIAFAVLAVATMVFVAVRSAFSNIKPRPARFRPPSSWQEHVASPRPRSERSYPIQAAPMRTKKVKEKPSGPQTVPPEFSVPGGVFLKNFSVELKAKSSAAVIRYTVDGSEPETNSPIYSGPVPVASTTLVQAKCFEPGLAPSPTATQTYTMLDDSLRQFSSNLPLVIISAFGQPIQHQSYVPASARFINLSGQRSTLMGPADFDGRGEIKRRGYSSLRLPKPSLSFKIEQDGDKKRASIFGLPADSDWVLYAPYSDKTLMRDVFAYELSNKMGRYAARTRFVEVFVNRGSSKLAARDYLGVYVFEEKIKRGTNRVNIAKLTADDNQEPEISGGYIFKRDHDGPPGMNYYRGAPRFEQPVSEESENGFFTRRGLHLFYVEPKEAELTPQQKNWLTQHLNQFERALYGPNFTSQTDGYAKYLDADSFIDQFWIVELSKSIDAFRYSCFMHKDRGGKIKMEPLWDWNLSFGNANYHEGWLTEGWYYPLIRESEICWFRRLIQDPDFAQKHIDRWGELRKDLFAPANLAKRVDQLAALLQESQERNFQRWPILGRSVNPNWYVGDSYADEVNWMKNWIRQRIAWIDRQFPAAPAFSEQPGPVKPGAKLAMRASAGKIYYTLDGSDPRVPGGSVLKKARVYDAPIVIDPNVRVFARVRREDTWSAPTIAQFTNP